MTAILDGRAPVELPPFDLPLHTAFRRKVWEELRRIPLGETASYAEIAQRIGQPKATRAVGGACGANPIPLIIPCHRVLAAGHRLGGFSGGLHWKRKLLALEGVVLSGEPECVAQKHRSLGCRLPFFEQFDPLTSRSKSGKHIVRMELHHKAKLGTSGLALGLALLVASPLFGAEKIQITGSTAIQLPKPSHILEDSQRTRVHDGPSGRSTYEGGMPFMSPMPNNPQSDKKLKEAIDRKKNWIFVNPYEMQFDNKTEEFLKAEKGTGLYNHRLMSPEEKTVLDRFIEERKADREREVETDNSDPGNNRGSLDQRPDFLNTAKLEEGSGEKPNSPKLQRGLSLPPTLEDKMEVFSERSPFQQKLDRSPFSETSSRSSLSERGGMTPEERQARDAELSKIYQPRVTAASVEAPIDPINRAFDATRQEATPFSARRNDQLFNVGRAAPSAGGRNSPIFTAPGNSGISAGLPARSSGFGDFGNRPAAPVAPNAAIVPPPSAASTFKAAPFVLPRPQRKF